MKMCNAKSILAGVIAVFLLFLIHRIFTTLMLDRQIAGNIRAYFLPHSAPRHRYEASQFRRYNLNTKTDWLPVCTWLGEQPLYLPDEDDNFEQTMITWLNEFNVTYSLSNGALIGAYRHHGKIPDDYDMDIAIPLWLNFDCLKNKQQKQKLQAARPCSLSLDYVVSKFEERNVATGNPFEIEKQSWGFRIFNKYAETRLRSFYVDVWLPSFDRWQRYFSATTTNHNAINNTNHDVNDDDDHDFNNGNDCDPRPPTCRCWYRSIPAQCAHDSLGFAMVLSNQTEEEILTPKIFSNQGDGARNAYYDRSVKNPFHPKWMGK